MLLRTKSIDNKIVESKKSWSEFKKNFNKSLEDDFRVNCQLWLNIGDTFFSLLEEKYPQIVSKKIEGSIIDKIDEALHNSTNNERICLAFSKLPTSASKLILANHSIYQDLIKELDACNVLNKTSAQMPVKLYFARKKTSIGLVFPTTQARDYIIRLLGGNSIKFSEEQSEELAKLTNNTIFLDNPNKYCLVTYKDKSSTNQIKTLYIPAFLQKDKKINVLFKNSDYLKNFVNIFNLGIFENITIKDNILNIDDPRLLNHTLNMSFNISICHRQASLFSTTSSLGFFPNTIVELITQYAHNCDDDKEKCNDYPETNCLVM